MKDFMQTTHDIKIYTQFYNRVFSEQKTFEIRKNDRDYQVGDILLMREYDPEKREYIDHSQPISAEIVYMSNFEQKEGYVVLGIKVRPEDQ